MRKVDEVKRDIDVMAAIADKIYGALKERYPDRSNNSQVVNVLNELDFGEDFDEGCVRQVAFWIYYGMKSLFLQDADALVFKTEHLVDVLNYVRGKFPTSERITA